MTQNLTCLRRLQAEGVNVLTGASARVIARHDRLIRVWADVEGETTRHPGILDGFELTREECEALIMQARLKAGWITEADIPTPAAPEDAEDAEATVEQPA